MTKSFLVNVTGTSCPGCGLPATYWDTYHGVVYHASTTIYYDEIRLKDHCVVRQHAP